MILTSSVAKLSEDASSCIRAWKINPELARHYLNSRSSISDQQRFLHSLIRDKKLIRHPSTDVIADFACGAGWQTIHAHHEFGFTHAALFELCYFGLELAEKNCRGLSLNAKFIHEDLCNPQFVSSESYDLALCLMTLCSLCWHDHTPFLKTMIDSLKPTGTLILSTLINRDHPEVNLTITQHEKLTGREFTYYIYGASSLLSLLDVLSPNIRTEIIPFNINTFLEPPDHLGVGTYTMRLDNSRLIEISAGAFFQWSFVIITRY